MSGRRPARVGIEEVPNQIFIGCPWKTVRPKYERCIDQLRKKYPLSFVIIGRQDGQEAEDLLANIKERLLQSSFAVFDASSGNANVSLEFGFSEAQDIPRALYVSTHGAAKQSSETPIIADLAGKKRNQYKQESGLLKLLNQLCSDHPYTIRFERFVHQTFRNYSKGSKKRPRALALKIIHCLDGSRDVRRTDVVQKMLADTGKYDRQEIDDMIRKLHSAGLIKSLQGPHSKVTIV